MMSLEQFQEKFKSQYLSKRYYDDKEKKKLWAKVLQLTIDKIVMKFTKLLQYVPYIRGEKAKVYWILNFQNHI